MNGWGQSNYIPINSGDIVKLNNSSLYYCVEYDSDKTFIQNNSISENAVKGTDTTPFAENTAFISIRYKVDEKDTLMIVKNMDIPSEYVPY